MDRTTRSARRAARASRRLRSKSNDTEEENIKPNEESKNVRAKSTKRNGKRRVLETESSEERKPETIKNQARKTR